MAANPYLSKLEREKLNVQIKEFFAKGNEVKMLETTELKPQRFIVNSKIVQPIDKLPPFHKRKGI